VKPLQAHCHGLFGAEKRALFAGTATNFYRLG
jgi:hypothetical protein